jgi:glycerol-3-phosphate acyltransferase PlsY
MTWLLPAAIGYVLGAVPFAYVAGRWFAGVDVRQVGSGNVGAANVLRHTRWSVGLTVLALDMGKGALAAWAGAALGGHEGAVAGAIAAVTGHVYPVWLRFAGGKGVATAAGAFMFLSPPAALGAIAAFAVILWRTRYVSLASMAGALLLPVLAAFTDEPWPTVIAGTAAAALVLFKHRDNLGRLRDGTERRLSGGASSSG